MTRSPTPLRWLGLRVVGSQMLAAQCDEARRLNESWERPEVVFGLLAMGKDSSDLQQRSRTVLDEVRAKSLEWIDCTRGQAMRLAAILRREVPHPAHEQSIVVLFLNRCRRAARGSARLPSISKAMGIAARLWSLADATGEPRDVDFLAGPPFRGVPETGSRRPAVTHEQRLKAIEAILAGTHTSTRAIADYIGASQSAVVRDGALRGAFKAVVRAPRHRGSRRREKGLEAHENDD